MRGFAHHGAKHALKMERRNTSRTCDQRQRQLPGKVDLDVVQRTVHAL
ncbi:glyoxalase, partial [Xanthomonas perforans]|nr:glyoxalase [Xanthomonas perforans]